MAEHNEVVRIGVVGGLVLAATLSAVPALFSGAGFAKISNATSAYAPIGALNIVTAGVFVALAAKGL